MSNRRLTARDYKSVRRGGLNLARLRDLGLGLATGLLVALIVYVGDHRAGPGAVEPLPTPRHAAPRTADSAGFNGAAGAEGASGSYDFYEGLPKFEVVVPEKEHGAHVDAAARIERPGTYFLQAGSYRNEADAERVQAQLARQNISANVQRVQLDADVWFRIRIGPIKDLTQLNRVRQQLQAAEIVSLVIRVED
ncbi:MAG TPA: SPOR domain-containing protein [Steroidobacteraceae bacterium]